MTVYGKTETAVVLKNAHKYFTYTSLFEKEEGRLNIK